ncbi:hypothetical protein ACSHT2_03395 [Bradyrhizobium sp. PUT101]|uniref:hypothetical protein n=1 Tax=Bradyrhizobium sp. PUT101 TaxID=3447427 RepID=UPI003F84522F
MTIRFSSTHVPNRGTNFMFGVGDHSTGAFLPDVGGALDAPMTALGGALARFGAVAARNGTEYAIDKIPAYNRLAVASTGLANAARDVRVASLREMQTIASAWANLTAVDPTSIATMNIRARALALLDAAPDVGNKVRLLQGFGEEQLAGVIESGGLDGLPPEIVEQAKARYSVLRAVRISGMQGDFPKRPSVDDVLANGPDVDAAENAARAKIDGIKARSKVAEAVARVLNETITVVELTCGLQRQDAYVLVMG